MKQYIQAAKDYITASKRNELIIGMAIVAGVAVLIAAITYTVYSSTPKVVYQPAKACDLLTSAEAKELLGGKAIDSSAKNPVVSGNTATSQCGYTDGNPDTENMIVAAVVVRSGVNDDGVQQNKTEFVNGKPTDNVEAVKDLGEDAYFNQKLGQLNVLNGREWIILSYGLGSAPEANTIDKAVELAYKVLPAIKAGTSTF